MVIISYRGAFHKLYAVKLLFAHNNYRTGWPVHGETYVLRSLYFNAETPFNAETLVTCPIAA